MKHTVTFNRVANGQFDVLMDGNTTQYRIVNGACGVAGIDTPNIYGVTNEDGNTKWIGTLQKAKKLVTYWLTKEVK